MRKVILSVAVSLEGLIEGPNGEYDWCFTSVSALVKHPPEVIYYKDAVTRLMKKI